MSQHSRLSHSPHPGASGGKGQTKPCSGHYNLRKTGDFFERLTKIITAMLFATATDGCKKHSLEAKQLVAIQCCVRLRCPAASMNVMSLAVSII